MRGQPVPGKEEYFDSEKYDFKVWDWDRPGNIRADIAKMNQIRKEHPALHEYDNLRFYWSDDDSILVYGKQTPTGRTTYWSWSISIHSNRTKR